MKILDRPRVFLGFQDICGVYRSLELALRELGLDAYFLNLGREHRPTKRKDPIPARIYMYWFHQVATPSGAARLMTSTLRSWMLKLSILLLVGWIYRRFDVIVLKSGGMLTSAGAEIAWLKRRGKIIVFSFHGSDSRPGFLNATDKPSDRIDEFCTDLAQRHEQLLTRAKLADYIIDSPTSAHWQPKHCCLRQVIFTPAPIHAFLNRSGSLGARKSVRILHCPSSPELKGTDVIRGVIQRLQQEGRFIDYVELVGVPNAQVIEELLQADIAIDELYSDNYGGIFALEAMTAGAAVVVGGYAKAELDRFVPGWARAPTCYTHPDSFYETVRVLVDDEVVREGRRREVKRYIAEVAAPIESAKRLIKLVSGEAPKDWFFDPKDIRYACGAAGPAWKAHRNIRAIVEARGSKGLLLEDKLKLRDFLVATA